MDFPITEQQFKQWVWSQPPHVYAGDSMNAIACPVVRCVKALCGQHIAIAPGSWSVVEYSDEAPSREQAGRPPHWVNEMVQRIDATFSLFHAVTHGELQSLVGPLVVEQEAVA